MSTKQNKAEVIQDLEGELVQIGSQIRDLRSREATVESRLTWFKSPYQYGDILEICKAKRQMVVMGIGNYSVHCSPIKKNGTLATTNRYFCKADNPVKVGRYTGSDLPPKPEEAAWVERAHGAEAGASR